MSDNISPLFPTSDAEAIDRLIAEVSAEARFRANLEAQNWRTVAFKLYDEREAAHAALRRTQDTIFELWLLVVLCGVLIGMLVK